MPYTIYLPTAQDLLIVAAGIVLLIVALVMYLRGK